MSVVRLFDAAPRPPVRPAHNVVHLHPVRRAHRITAVLSPLLPGLLGVPYEDPRRWRCWWGEPPEAAVRELLRQLGRGPEEITLQKQPMGSIALMGAAMRYASIPLAFVTSGIEEDELAGILAGLAAAGWRPPPEPSSPGAA